MANFTGVLAVIGSESVDGRMLGDPAPELTRPLPLPLVAPGLGAIGRIDRVWRDGALLRYSGVLDDDAQEARTEIEAGRMVGMLDVDMLRSYQEDEFSMEPSSGVFTLNKWRVAAATLLSSELKGWAEVELTMIAEEEG